MKTVQVSLGKRSYDITIGTNALENLSDDLHHYFPSEDIIVVTNSSIADLYKKEISQKIEDHFIVQWVIIPDGERYKNLKTVEKIYHELIKLKAHRKTGIIALGGGVVGDIAGFVASSYLRGIPFMQIPTTLLAQVDSSVGGKTGIDLKEGKNLVGAFYQPSGVLIDLNFLKTLPKREFLCGLSEIVKYGVIWNAEFFEYIENNVGKILELNHNVLQHLISRSCEIKALIVSRDEKEIGLRALLNFGHTLGHAIETISGYNSVLHGEAISQGMVYATHLSQQLNFCSEQDVKRLTDLLKALGLPTQWPSYSKRAYEKTIAIDKKAIGKKVNYVAIKKIGKAFMLPLSPSEITKYL